MTRFVVGPDGTRYKVVPNALPDPQDYGWLEPAEEETPMSKTELWDGTARGYFRWWRNSANRRYARRSAWQATRSSFVSWKFFVTYVVVYVITLFVLLAISGRL